MDTQNVFVVSCVIVQSTNNSVFIAEQFSFCLLIKLSRIVKLIFTRFNSQDSTSLLERNISKIAEKTKEIFESEFSQNKILSKIACVEICDENCTYICTSVFQFITYTRLRFPRIFLGKKKYAIEWDTVSSISPGLRAIESTHADLRLGRGVA